MKPLSPLGIGAMLGLVLVTLFPSSAGAATDDERELIKMPSSARLVFRAEMRERMVALDEVMQHMSNGKIKEAGIVASQRLGRAVWDRQQRHPESNRPAYYMPVAMQRLAQEGHQAASDFATVAQTGDRATAQALLYMLTGSCANCHASYRVR